jgi:acyl carrier protein
MAIFEDVKEIVAEQLSIDTEIVKLESKIKEDLGADSLDVVELVMALEEKFGVDIPDEQSESIITVQDAIDFIEKNK